VAAAALSTDAAAQLAIDAVDRWPAALSSSNPQKEEEEEPYDAIVVGLGAHGSSALYHLARRFADEDASKSGTQKRKRRRVLGLEAHAVPGHTRASHGGDTRITRQAYFESPLYVPLLRRSFQLTSELENLVKTQLFWRTGVLHAGGKLFDGALQAARKHNVEHESLRWNSNTQERWPGVSLPKDTPVLWEPGAGVLAPEKMIRAHVAAAVASGAADVLCGEGVAKWGNKDSLVTVETTGGRVFKTRGALVLAAGAWMPRLVPELVGWAVPRRYIVAWLEEKRRKGHYSFGTFPPFLMEEPGTGVAYYGFPAWPHPGVGGGLSASTPADDDLRRRRQNAVKLGAFLPSSPDLTAGGTADPGQSLNRAMTPQDEQDVRRFADACLPGLKGGDVVGFSACMFTDTPDGHFLLDAHPRYSSDDDDEPRVILCSACSGHGFKLSPAVGEALADLAVRGRGEAARRYGEEGEEVLALHRLRGERPGMKEVLERFGGRRWLL
jgi:sarcosine oxidase